MQGYSLTYIYHDCFIMETNEAILLFDYWKDPLSSGKEKDYPPLLNEINPSKKFYIIISHHHKDHFTRRIFLWESRFPKIRYIISKDVYRTVRYMMEDIGNYKGFRPSLSNINVLSPGESYKDEILSIKAFPSTDIGNSYAIVTNGMTIFHAGDLNAWLWLDDSTDKEVGEARQLFCDIVADIHKEFPSFDVVMFPVDSRMGREYWWGASYFVHSIKVRLFVPMHFELVENPEDKEQRRIDAAAFNLFARENFGMYLQLTGTRSKFKTFS